jgi:hypothetical protein
MGLRIPNFPRPLNDYDVNERGELLEWHIQGWNVVVWRSWG